MKTEDLTAYEAINWNNIEDMVDKLTWNKLVEQFWLDTRVAVANDVQQWKQLSEEEKTLFNKIFGGLTLLDTLQSQDGVQAMIGTGRTQHEEAVMTNIQFMESVHAKSYSTIFSTFNSPKEIDEIFEWIHTDKNLQFKAETIRDIYLHGSELHVKAASVLLESFLFYSGFYTPLKYLGEAKMVNVAEVIKLIIRDESVHGTYFGYKFRNQFDQETPENKQKIKEWVYDLTFKLYMNEVEYTQNLYNSTTWTQDVIKFVEYNANKALDNLGFDPLFATIASDCDPVVMNGLSTSTSNHDFFSQAGNGYLMGTVEGLSDGDYSSIREMANVAHP